MRGGVEATDYWLASGGWRRRQTHQPIQPPERRTDRQSDRQRRDRTLFEKLAPGLGKIIANKGGTQTITAAGVKHWGFHGQFVFTVSQCAPFGCPNVHHLVCVICPNVHHFGCPNVHHLVCGRCPNVHHLARVQCPSVHHQWVFFHGPRKTGHGAFFGLLNEPSVQHLGCHARQCQCAPTLGCVCCVT